MAKGDSGNQSISAAASVTITFSWRTSNWVIWADVSFRVEEDADADGNSFLVPANTLYAPAIDVLTLGVLGVGSGIAHYKNNWRRTTIDDQEIQNDRGGVHRL